MCGQVDLWRSRSIPAKLYACQVGESAVEFSSKSTTPLRQLVELSGNMAALEEGAKVEVRARLYLDEAETDVGEHTLRVGLRAAYISATAEGGEICGDTKHGTRIHPDFIDKTTSLEELEKRANRSVKGGEYNLSFSAAPTGPGLGIGGKKSSSQDVSTEQSFLRKSEGVNRHIPVEMKGGDLWKVSNEKEALLSGTYLSKEQVLFRVIRDNRLANRFGASLAVHAKRRDINVQIVRQGTLLKPSTQTLLNLLVSKQLAEVAQDKNPETITFARVDIFDE